ncbi:MAG: cell surface protein SprA [Candidatus Zixiibacteriota bacterium]|nr:MAG: cell surface protein SprA [candidate division Zixibacteria bacterium]
MYKRLLQHLRFLLLSLIIIISCSTSINAIIGFQATLEPYPFIISPFEEKPDRLSVALQPKSYPLLSRKLKRTPRHASSDFESNSHRFETSYYVRGKYKQNFIPVSVDADKYMLHRFQANDDEYFGNIFSLAFSDPSRKKRRGGLGFNVDLPKRFDKIFGEGGAGLQVSGYRRISFSGRSRWTDASQTDTFRQSKFPSLNMEQVSRFEITGTIGSKITVKVAQDSQTDIPLSNRLQIRYKGDDDDILKSVEAGNTNLSIPNTRFVGYNQKIQGLFGLKAEAQIGDLTLTTIASQEKGSSERKIYTPTGEEGADYIRDYEFTRNRIFDLAYSDSTILGMPDPYQKGDSIVRLIVYEQVTSRSMDTEDYIEADPAQLFPDPTHPNRQSFYLGEQPRIRVQIVSPDQYSYEFKDKTDIPYIVFKSSRTSSKTFGFYMEIEKPNGQLVKIGDVSQENTDSLYLKILVLASGENTPQKRSWSLMWRNCYQIPRGVSVDDIDLKIFKGDNGVERTTTEKPDFQTLNNKEMKFIEIYGLDQYNTSNTKVPDGILDDRSEVFRADWGLIIFPDREPFNSDTTFVSSTGKSTQQLQEKVPELYNTITTSQQFASQSKYYLQLSTKSRSSIISLNQANIIENSERVMVNGRQLQKDKDYRIQYDFGQITLLSHEALDPNADISIDFEYSPFLSVQKKTLLGARAQYRLTDDISFGSTALYKSDKAQDRKPKVGQETATMVVLDFDATAKFQPNFLTTLANSIPLVETEVPSNFQISGEFAQSHPNPNVNDVAYVDDFEAALDQLSLGMTRTNWHISSKPYQITLKEEDAALSGDSITFNRGNLKWHRPILGGEIVALEDVFDREAGTGESGVINTLRFIFDPDNINITEDTLFSGVDTIVSYDTSLVPSFAGVTRYFNSRVDAQRVQLFEFRARFSDDAKGKIHFDFGKINEDIDIYKEHLNNAFTEDGYDYDGSGSNFENATVEFNEDVGLDGLPDSMEVDEFGNGYDPDTNPDPGGDNWYYLGDGKCPLPSDSCAMLNDENSPLWEVADFRYRWLNGTEGNIRDGSAIGSPDEEALSDNGMNTINSYYSYEVDLESSEFAVIESERNGWMTYRIPIREPELTDTLMDTNIEPDWEQITHVRVWFEADSTQNDPLEAEIAAWYFVQSNWQDTVIFDELSNYNSRMTVATISSEDGTFSAPPGVEAYRDPVNDYEEPQRGLLLKFDSLQYLDTALVTKELLQIDQYSGYKKMKMYVNVPKLSESADSVQFFFRVGSNLDNYYEHKVVLQQASNWEEINYVEMDFSELSKIKDSVFRTGEKLNNLDVSSGKYRIVGNPNLNEIRFFGVGVVNIKEGLFGVDTGDVSGEIWLDELRVTDVRRDVGTAMRISTQGSVADLFQYNFSYQDKDPYFRGISAATRGGSDQNLGSGKTEKSMSYGFSLSIDKFLPRSWGAKLPLRYSYSKRTLIPLLRNGTDILLPEEIRQQEQSISTSQSISLSGVSFNHKGKNPLFTLILNRLIGTSFSYRLSKKTDVLTPYQFSENVSIKSGFDFGVKKPPKVPIFFWAKSIPILKKASESELGLYPSKFSVSGNFERNLTITDNKDLRRTTSFKRNFNGNLDLTYPLFQNLNLSFRYRTVRDLSSLDPNMLVLSFSNPKLGIETRFQHNFSANYDPKLLTFLSATFSFSSSYTEDYDKTYEAYRSALNRSMGASGTFNHMSLFGSQSSSSGTRRFRGGSGRGTRSSNEVKKDGKPFYDPVLSVFRFLTGWINPVKYKYDVSFKNSIPGITVRPGWKYRLGFTREPGDLKSVNQNRNPQSSESEAYSLSSGFTFLGGLRTDVRIKESTSKDLVSVGQRFENISRSWPDLTIRIQKFNTLPILKPIVNKLIDIFSPKTGFTRSEKERLNIDDGYRVDFSEKVSFNPLISLNLKLIRSLSVSGSYTISKDNSFKYNQTNGDFRSETKSTQKKIATSAKYSFTSPGGISIPLFGKFKFKSTAHITLNVKYSSTLGQTRQASKDDFISSSDKSDLSVAPEISYQFSSKIRGGIKLRWQDTNDRQRSTVTHVREVKIWTEIRF